MLRTGIVAGLALGTLLLVALHAFRRRGPQRIRWDGADDAFGDPAAGYQKDPSGRLVDDRLPGSEEEEVTCPECNAVLIYGIRLDEQENGPPARAGGKQRVPAPGRSEEQGGQG